MALRTYHVLPVRDRWRILCDKSHLGDFADRESALSEARRLSRSDRRARVVVHSWFYDLEQEVVIGSDDGEHGPITWFAR